MASRSGSPSCLEVDLALDEERDDRHEQGDALDERRRDDHGRLDPRGRLRLTGDAFGSPAADEADADAGADDREAGREAGADEAVAPVRPSRGSLQEGENV